MIRRKVIYLMLLVFLVPGIASAVVIPLPEGQHAWQYTPTAIPSWESDPSQGKPIGFGSVASGGETLNIQIGAVQFSGLVDIYFVIYAPSVDPVNLYLLWPNSTMQPLSAGIKPWKEQTTDLTAEAINGDIPISMLPSGTYYFYFLVTSHASLENRYLWSTSLRVPERLQEAVLVDFSNIVTQLDGGFNDFSGNMGDINKNGKPYGASIFHCTNGDNCMQRLDWDFEIDPDREAFTGLFYSLFGLTDTKTTFDGSIIETIQFSEHSIDLDRIDGILAEPGGARRFEALHVTLSNNSPQGLALRVELKDTTGGGRFKRFLIPGFSGPTVISWDFRNPSEYKIIGEQDLDIHKAKVVSFVIERENIADSVQNPLSGSVDVHRIWLSLNRSEVEPFSDTDLIDLTERRAAQYFFDWASRKTASFGIPQDRSTFGDLLTMGGVGFALPGYIIASERVWIQRSEAIDRVLSVLRIMNDLSLFGPERIGRIGYKGWFYHFLGVDNRRKLNFDFSETVETNEALNTVELSTIDTGLALMGVLVAQSYFDRDDPREREIRQLAQSIYDRVDWNFMLEPVTKQFFLGWKPREQRNGPAFDVPDAVGQGHYSGVLGRPATLDYYTDEASIVTILALGSTTYPIPSSVYCAVKRNRDQEGLIRTYPGTLFTYQFLHAFLDTKILNLPACPGEPPVDWFANSRLAISRVIDYARNNPRRFLTYGDHAWGISAAEGPDDSYKAYGVPAVAIDPAPPEDGTITYYPMLSAISFGQDLAEQAFQVARSGWSRHHWHPRFGLPDAYNSEISQAELSSPTLLRTQGPWVQRALFSIDQGPMLLHLENARSGLIWSLTAKNPNIQRALDRLRTPPPAEIILLEGEGGTGLGQIMTRSAASGKGTVWLHTGESRMINFQIPSQAHYSVNVRYSNDNFGSLETVQVEIDGSFVGQFIAQDTGDYGFGWNNFLWSDSIAVVDLSTGSHQMTITTTGGDGYGVEIDVARLDVR